eukprot:CAMPEP_0201868888 /NCGR_PEP_ID=MMETSP0902-20130614/2605_1 /ASSEMBLY_ACC=CAM_ASM_000551 /TAXON_ID=420261 /ORGANISM="Thalassiosira antarctica, Strain CCMP982" /LENGTH=103 /DNA_ID=CAMNT_0048394289 /DNA_START=102 /DNA_END=413 /DNA_ORIENTATION=+
MTAEHDEANQIESVTDRVQEKELDASRANQALGALSTTTLSTGEDDASSTVKKEDVDVIVAELEVTEDEAEAALRAAAAVGGNGSVIEGQELVAAALRRLVVA